MRALDADVVIGFLDPGDAHHAKAVRAITGALDEREPLAMSAAGYSEVLVHALARDRRDIVDGLVDDARIEIRPVDRSVARAAAEIRSRHRGLRLPDALALASALRDDAELVTFDLRLRRIAAAEAVEAPRPTRSPRSPAPGGRR